MASGDAGVIAKPSRRWPVITALGVTQIFAWGSSYYLPAVLAAPIVADTGWSLTWVIGGLSIGLLAAGLVSPLVGRAIAARGGRPVLAIGTCLLAAGLLLLAVAHSLPAFLIAWLVIGFGMGAGLYDPAFATLGRLYGEGGRSAIASLTLFGGFASTVCWPLSASLEAHLGWRGTCLAYAGLQLAMALPIYLFAIPREPQQPVISSAKPALGAFISQQRDEPGRGLLILLATTITLASMISTALSVHLLTMLQAKGLALAVAVSLGALVGPAQVTARAIEMLVARYHHPIWTKLVSSSLVTVGVAALWMGAPIITLGLLLYGAGIGLESIARGTLPLAIFGAERFPIIMGRIAMPSLMAQAAAPSIGAGLLETVGLDGAWAVFLAAAAFNVVLAVGLFVMLRSFARSSVSLVQNP